MEIKAEKITPYSDDRQKGEQVREMFDTIAPAYDFMNRAMTLGIDKIWRARAVRLIASERPRHILDVATGTGDLAIKMAQKAPQATVTGIDLSQGMIDIGNKKIARKDLTERVSLRVADCLDLPFPDDTFDCVTVAYGVRNFQHLLEGYREMERVLRPGGLLCVLELSTPTSPITRPLYNLYTRHIIPLVGRLISKDTRAYSYLPESIAACAQGDQMTQLMRQAGMTEATHHPMTLGTCTLYTARKPH